MQLSSPAAACARDYLPSCLHHWPTEDTDWATKHAQICALRFFFLRISCFLCETRTENGERRHATKSWGTSRLHGPEATGHLHLTVNTITQLSCVKPSLSSKKQNNNIQTNPWKWSPRGPTHSFIVSSIHHPPIHSFIPVWRFLWSDPCRGGTLWPHKEFCP